MRSICRCRVLSFAALAAVSMWPGLVRADVDADTHAAAYDSPGALADPTTDRAGVRHGEQVERHVELTFGSGYAFGTMRHPNFAQSRAGGLFFELDVGVALDRHWSVGLFFNHLEMPIDHVGDDMYVKRGSERPPQLTLRVPCANCAPALAGGDTLAKQLYTAAVGPRIEVAPFGQHGPYVGVSGGVAAVVVERHEVGGVVGFRAGYRLFATNAIGVGLGISVQGIKAQDAQAWLSMASLDIRACFHGEAR
ncbi:MAG: hypothetical protein V3V08_16420 [Nannocystaceae bacterium]